MAGCLVGQQYRLVKPIGFGTFGEIHRGIDIITKRDVAVKLERFQSRHPQLSNERRVYEVLRGGEGVPKVHWFGVEELDRIEYNVMVMDLLGPSLEDLFLFCSKKFTMKTVLMLADQMIDRIEFMHSKWFIHRDIKPNNFLMGVSGRCGLLSLVDLGLAKKYKESDSQVSSQGSSGKHIDYREDKALVGTARYVSVNVHMGREQSRRDDLVSLGYVLLYFNRGSLPWQGRAVRAETSRQKHDKILERKTSITEEELCKGLPMEFILYLNYCKSLGFYERPDYQYLRHLFKDLFQRLRYEYDSKYDWTVLKEKGVTRKDCEQRVRSRDDVF